MRDLLFSISLFVWRKMDKKNCKAKKDKGIKYKKTVDLNNLLAIPFPCDTENFCFYIIKTRVFIDELRHDTRLQKKNIDSWNKYDLDYEFRICDPEEVLHNMLDFNSEYGLLISCNKVSEMEPSCFLLTITTTQLDLFIKNSNFENDTSAKDYCKRIMSICNNNAKACIVECDEAMPNKNNKCVIKTNF